jgi:hypothetical protein
MFCDEASAMIVDFSFYTYHVDEIDDWLHKHDSERTGMVIKFSDAKTRTMFALLWG